MTVPNRSYSSPSYRYGFQGQEKDDEVKGNGNSINYKYRMHDPRVGRFFATDPLEPKYPWYTPYQFSGNKVIQYVELEGLEEGDISLRDAGFAPDQLIQAGADGYANYSAIIGEWFISDETEGQAIFNILSSKYYEEELERQGISYGALANISNEELGSNFKIRKRNGYYVIEPEKGILSDFFDVTVSVLDIAALSPAKGGGMYMSARTFAGGKTISSILKSLKINARAKEILDTFFDAGGSGKYSKIEAEGAAILEDAYNTTLRAVKKFDPKSGDFIFTKGKFANKSVDMISAVKNFGFKLDKFIKSIDSHFLNKGATTDFFNIDIRALSKEGKKTVKNHVSKMSKANQKKVIYTE